MTSLKISCALACDRKMKRRPGPLTLTRFVEFEDESEEEEWIVTDVKTIHIGDGSSVFRAQVHRPNDTPLDAVLKVDPTGERHSAFMKEVEVYQTKGMKLQGVIIPIFYGCFHVELNQTPVTCLVMEYCGEPMKLPLHRVENPFMSDLLLYVAIFHQHGMTHGDLYERNILVLNERPVLIDLESTTDHTCMVRMNTVPGALIPSVEEYGCAELHDLIVRMGLWHSDTLHFCAHNIVKKFLDSVEDIKRFIPECYPPEWKQELEDEADQHYEQICKDRRVTYGAHRLSGMCFVACIMPAHHLRRLECKTRLDIIKPASSDS
ncbi:hypothetical protein C8R43DRAFT_51499 [Mycena crocata]|nr:hypothetical protein C8R43DRAFT_51499 [Mycena crocata]